MKEVSNTILVWVFLGGWIVTGLLLRNFLKDHEANVRKMTVEFANLDNWTKEHEKGHVNMMEILRMHNENREMVQRILDNMASDRISLEASFRHLTERVDRLAERTYGGGSNGK